jgi:hypothetical protein
MIRFRPVSLFPALSLGAFAFAVACGGAPVAGPATPETTPAGEARAPGQADETSSEAPRVAPEPGLDGIAWQDMNRDQRIAYMKTRVVPAMGPLLRGFDPKQFSKVTCVTCHGEGAKKNEFQMPTDALPKLSPAGGFAKHMKSEPEMTKFMMDKVVPQMAALLGEQPYDPATQKGFGCFNCHMPEK